MNPNNDNVDYKNYMSLLSLHYQRIYSFVLMLVANHNDTDDIMQETSILMYEKFHFFEKGSDFFAWAKTIAKYKTLEFLKKQKRDKVVFNQEIVNLIDHDSQSYFVKHNERIDALRECVSLLPEPDRQLLHIRYHRKTSVTDIARCFGCSFQKIYRDMARINNVLILCIRQKIESAEF